MDNHINLLDFEWQALRALFSQNGIIPPDRENIAVLSREHTGVGCYTEIEVVGISSLMQSRKVFSTVHVDVEGLANGMTLILWRDTDDTILLEAVTHGESMPSEPVIARLLG